MNQTFFLDNNSIISLAANSALPSSDKSSNYSSTKIFIIPLSEDLIAIVSLGT